MSWSAKVALFFILLSLSFIVRSSGEAEVNANVETGQLPSESHNYATLILSELTLVENYIEFISTSYEEALAQAEILNEHITGFLSNPTMESHDQAKAAWIKAHRAYTRTEVFRFGNPEIDNWEGRVNAWPVDESLIDYVASDGEKFNNINVISNEKLESYGRQIDASRITPVLLQDLHELGGEEANVATGYHAIEFLLWGQDLNGTKPGAGNRYYSDYDISNCSNENCSRRRDYLKSASELLVEDLAYIVDELHGGELYGRILLSNPEQILSSAFQGMITLSAAELAGERIRLAG